MQSLDYCKFSGHKLMWMLVMFDLPVLTKKEIKEANKFRNFLKDLGFEMAQLSVYTRFVGSKEKSSRYVRAVENRLPKGGNVSILFFTDKQFENIISFKAKIRQEPPKKIQTYMQF